MSHILTKEQEQIIEAATKTKDNLMINACAGCGKTSTLEMIERVVDVRPILYLCYNKKIADDARERMLSTTTVRTFNALGHRIWQKFVGKTLALNPRKTQDILRTMIDEVKDRTTKGEMWDSFWAVVAGVALAKAIGYVPEGKFTQAKRLCTQSTLHSTLDESPDDLTSDLIDAVLTHSIAAAYEGNIDYNDQVYMPSLFGGVFPQFPLVKVDEAQDLNPVNHAILDKLVKHRLIAVGDPWQSIYGFRGAVQGGMASIASRFATSPLDLSTSFRCPQAIVEAARWRVPHFKWIKEGGHAERLKELRAADIPDESAILSRNNAPLFKVAMQLLAASRPVQVAGSDIGPKLIGIMRKLCDEGEAKATVLSAIDGWLDERLARGSTTAQDLADCMRVFAGFGDSLGQAISYAEHLFAQRGSIRLMTGHKAKGLEFPVVFHLDPWLIREDEQDLNLKYVITTRSMDQYYEIDSRSIQW